ncbi:MAG: branched-chain amino acid ABC transporter permease [Caldimonas sp.]
MAALLGTALALPWLLQTLGFDFYLSLASRIVVFAIAATSLNLVLGYGGMVSFGHAAFVGLGAYVTGVMISEGVQSGLAHLAATVAITALAALLIGAISLRTRGVYFIMITLAFAQMLYFLANSVKGYGGDEGLNVRARSLFAIGGWVLDLKDPFSFYYVALALLAAALVALGRFVPSRFGRAVLALRDDDVRAEAIGFPTYRYKLVVFVVAGALGGVAGMLSVNLQGYVSPNVLHWTQSGTLMVMVILGGVATVWGGLAGAATLLLLQEVLSSYTEHAEFWTGWVLLAVVLFARQGLVGILAARRGRRRAAP